MKLHENFVGKLLEAVRASQGKDPLAATALIQDALRDAGLLPAAAAPAPAPAAERAARFVDLNAAPAWAGKARKADPARAADEAASGAATDAAASAAATGAAAPAASPIPAQLREAFAGWAGKLKQHQGGARQAHPDPAAPGRFLEGEFGNAAGTRRYRLYVPARPAQGPRPLVVMLHGCKQDPEDFAAGTAMNALAERHDCLVLYPGQASTANGSNCWNWFEARHQQAGEGEPSIIAGMTRAVMGEHGVDPARVYVAGLSAGGAMAAILGAAHPDLYAAVGVHSGLPAGCAHDLMSGLNAMKGAHGKRAARTAVAGRSVPAIVFHGDGDAVVHPSNGAAVVRQFGAGDASLRQVEERGQDPSGRGYTKTVALDGDGRAVVEYWVLHGAGHAWAGGSPAGSYTDAAGPAASEQMLRFFLQQRLA